VPEGIYGYASDKLDQAHNSYQRNTYKGIRLVSDDYSLYYAVWCTNEKEFYDLKVCEPLVTTGASKESKP
jgi:N-acetylglucosamine-6-sulfatase